MNNRPALSQASPTGRKQSSGHFELSWLRIIGITAVVLFAAAVGIPLLNPTVKRRYPSGASRFLQTSQAWKHIIPAEEEQEGLIRSSKAKLRHAAVFRTRPRSAPRQTANIAPILTTTTIDASYMAESTETEPPWKTLDHGLQQCRVKEADLKTGRQGRCSIWTRRPPPRIPRSNFVNSVPMLQSNLEKGCSHRDSSDRRRCRRIPDRSKWPRIYRRRCGAQHRLSMTYMLGRSRIDEL